MFFVFFFISQTCDQERFESRKVVFSWECLNIFATGCSLVPYFHIAYANLDASGLYESYSRPGYVRRRGGGGGGHRLHRKA